LPEAARRLRRNAAERVGRDAGRLGGSPTRGAAHVPRVARQPVIMIIISRMQTRLAALEKTPKPQ
jgi:hypothetical protein